MENSLNRQTEQNSSLNRRVGLVLRAGTIISLLLMTAGLILFLISKEPGLTIAALTPLASLFPDLLSFRPAAVVTLGLLLILFMPVIILLTSLYHFIQTRETVPVILCLVLTIMLAISYVLALK